MISLALTTSAALSMMASGLQEETIQFDFEGGTVAEYVQEIQKHEPGLNVIIKDSVADVELPAFKVRVISDSPDTTPGERLLEELLPSLAIQRLRGSEIPLIEVSVNYMGGDDHDFQSRLYTVETPEIYEELERMTSLKHTIAIGLGGIDDSSYSESDLLAAIEASMQGIVDGLDEDDWSIRYH
ncbi:MAG: hypothetical protein VX527_08160, partial [Planctomycetota bacterium]|nr:hypothetical protein [Planctomycetota bacterium]